MTEYFFISDDLVGFWYVVPQIQRAVWFGMRDQGFPDEMPYWARSIEGPEDVLFFAPKYLED